MKYFLLGSIAAAMLIMSGCGQQAASNKTTTTGTSAAPQTTSTPISSKPSTSAAMSPSPEPSSKPAEDKKKPNEDRIKLSVEEQLAVDYINEYHNETDPNKRKKFIDEKVDPDYLPVFSVQARVDTEDTQKFNNPLVVDTLPAAHPKKKQKFVLVKAKDAAGKNKERIILTSDGKIALIYSPDSKDEDVKKTYEDLRGRFKTK